MRCLYLLAPAMSIVLASPAWSAYECSNNTLANGTALAAGVVCRPAAAGGCDVPEVCDGVALSCPGDAFKAADTVCRNATTVCDAIEVCNGTSASCPVDSFQSNLTIARPLAGACDVAAEYCSGSDDVVPPDVFKAQGTVCRAAVNTVCDVEETCPGNAAACPTDRFAPNTKLVRASTSNDDCDPAEYCSGLDSIVPADKQDCSRVAIDVKGQSGKFSIYDEKKGSNDTVSGSITVT